MARSAHYRRGCFAGAHRVEDPTHDTALQHLDVEYSGELALLPRLLSALPPLLSSRPSLPQAALLYLALTSALLAGASAAHALLKPDLTLPPPAVPRAPAAPPPLPPPPPQPPQQLR